MAGGTIHVDEAALTDLREALTTAGDDYKRNLARLTALIQEFTSGDIQGDPANDLLAKFNAKEDTFKRLANTIDEAQEYMGIQTQKFGSMISGLQSGMK